MGNIGTGLQTNVTDKERRQPADKAHDRQKNQIPAGAEPHERSAPSYFGLPAVADGTRQRLNEHGQDQAKKGQ